MSKPHTWQRSLLFHALFIGVLAVLLGVLLYLNMSSTRVDDMPPAFGQVPGFTLTDQDGEAFTETDLRGKYTVANFIFTRCPGPCAALSRQFSEFQKAIADSDDIQLLTVSVDPEFDQPEVLRDYAQSYRAEPGRWQFVTGEKRPVYELIQDGFKVTARENTDPEAALENLFIHTTKIVLIDPQGRIRGYYNGTDPLAYGELLADIQELRQ